jgi:hypothetical protein
MSKPSPLANDFCRCIKKVRKTVKLRNKTNKSKKGKEKAAIAICVISVLQRKGKTLKRFHCRPKPHLIIQTSKHLGRR